MSGAAIERACEWYVKSRLDPNGPTYTFALFGPKLVQIKHTDMDCPLHLPRDVFEAMAKAYMDEVGVYPEEYYPREEE